MPKCEGPKKCPIGGNHPANGDEYALGCSVCRNVKENQKDFWIKYFSKLHFKTVRINFEKVKSFIHF